MKSNSVFNRALSILLCLLMILPICSGLAIGGFAEDPAVKVEENEFYRVEYENGVFHVILDADKLNEVVKTGDITKDDLISMIPDEIYNILQERTLSSVIAALQTMMEEKKVTGGMVTDIVSFETISKIVEEYDLLNIALEVIDTTSPAFEELIKNLIEDGKLDNILTNESLVNRLIKRDLVVATIQSNETIRNEFNKLMTADAFITANISDLKPTINDNLEKWYSRLLPGVDPDKLSALITDAAALETLKDAEGNLDIDKYAAYVYAHPDLKEPVAVLVTNTYGGYNEILTALGGLQTVINDIDGGYPAIAEAFGGYIALIDKLGPHNVVECFSSDYPVMADCLGGYSAIATGVVKEGLFTQFPLKDTLRGMLQSEILNSIDQTAVKEKVIPVMNRFITEQIPYVDLNGVEIYTGEDYTVPSTQMFKLHPAVVEKVLLGLIPPASAFAGLQSGEVFLSLMFDTVLYEEAVHFGFDVCFEGNMSKINEGSGKIAEYLTYALNDEGVFVVNAVSPEETAALYKELLASEEVDASFKTRILNLYTTSGAEYDELLESITLEEIRTALKVIDESGNKYIDRAIEYTLKALDRFENKFEGGKAKLSDLLNRIPEDLKVHTIEEYYNGNSVFHLNYTASVSALEWMDKAAGRYESVAEYIDMVKKFVDSEPIVQTFDVTATATNVFKATFKDLEGNVLYTTFLPTDLQISTVVALLPELNAVEAPFGWVYEGGTKDGEAALLMIGEDATIVVAETPSYGYTVQHWVEGLDGSYTVKKVETGSVLAGETATATAQTFEGFTFDATVAGTVLEAVVEADGSTTLKLFYTRNSYTLTWNLDGGTAAGEYTKGTVRFEAPITAPTAVTKDGYTFTGWDQEIPATMPAGDVTLTALYEEIPTVYAGYKTEHYTEGLDGIYKLEDTETFTNIEVGTVVNATAKTFAGFTLDKSINGTVATATVAEDGSTTLKLFYTRNSYTLTWNLDGGTATGEYTQGSVKFGAPITAPTAVEKKGYTFTGWNKDVPATMPAENVTLTAQFDVKSGDNTAAIIFFAAVTLTGCAITVVAMKKRED